MFEINSLTTRNTRRALALKIATPATARTTIKHWLLAEWRNSIPPA